MDDKKRTKQKNGKWKICVAHKMKRERKQKRKEHV